MASLAGDIHIGPASGIVIGGEVVILLQIGGMAARALIVPGLVASGPMEAVAGWQGLAGVRGKPTLAAVILRTAVPRDPERLIAAARKGDHILLQGIDAERVGDFIVVQRAVGALGPHHELFAIAGKRRCDAVVGQCCVGEIAEDCRCCGLLHGEGVMRIFPAIGFRRVATGACLGADECGRCVCLRFCFRRVHGQQTCRRHDGGDNCMRRIKIIWRNS